MRAPTLQLVASEGTLRTMKRTPLHINVTFIRAFQTVCLGPYTVTALPARHMAGAEALIYIIRDEASTLLYAHDTGYFLDEVFDYIRDAGLVFDMVTLDCTNVDIPIDDSGSHMGFPNVVRVLSRLQDMGALREQTLRYVNHFSHNANPMHDRLCARASEVGCAVAYDGCTVIF